jgi:hypothetical protein
VNELKPIISRIAASVSISVIPSVFDGFDASILALWLSPDRNSRVEMK